MTGKRSNQPAAGQSDLPFAEIEGTKAELKNMLGIALLKVNANIYLAQLCVWVFNVTTGMGRREPLRKSYAELSQRPWGLCCHPTNVACTVKKARRLRLLTVTETWSGPGIQGPNEYAINWAGVQALVALPMPAPPHSSSDPGHSISDPPHSTSDPGHSLSDQYKEYTSSHLFSPSESESERQRPRMASDDEGSDTPVKPRMAGRMPDWLDEVPEVQEARLRRIAPLPPAGLVYGAFESLREEHLSTGSLVPWFRRQLGCQRPVTTDSEGELLLVLAAGLAAAAVPREEVSKSRCGIFVATVKRALWPKVLKHVPAARKLLDTVLAEYPEALTAADGLGVKRDEALAEVAHA
jgi:hypothetical protein